jgi:type IV secretory pathway VirB6-like protein
MILGAVKMLIRFLLLSVLLLITIPKSFAEDQSTTNFDDNFFTRHNISPACTGTSYYKLVEINQSGGIVREFLKYDTKYSYYIPSWTDYTNWFNDYKTTKRMDKTKFKKMMFASSFKTDPFYSSSGALKSGITESSNPTSGEYKHKSPVESQAASYVGTSASDNGLYYYEIKVSDDKNGIWPVCIAGCAFSRYPMMSRIVECFDGTIKMLISGSNPLRNNKSIFQIFQRSVRVIVIMIVVVFVALTGIQTILGQGFAKDGIKPFIFTMVKISLVTYFAIGDAWKDYFFWALRSIVSGAGSIVIDAASPTNYDGCKFSTAYYPRGMEVNSIFDMFDCKVANYIGYFRDTRGPVLVNMFMFFLIFPPVFGVLINVLITTYVTILFNIFALATQMYVSASLYIMLLIFISPLAISAMLFSNGTIKSIFDGWLRMLIGSSLNQILTISVIAIFIPMMDSALYGGKDVQEKLFVSNPDYSTQDDANRIFGPGRDEALNTLINSRLPSYPPQLNPSQTVKDVSKNCSTAGSFAIKYSMVCMLVRMNSWGQIEVLPFFLKLFVFYIPSPEILFNPIGFVGTFVYAIFILFIIHNMFSSSSELINKLSSDTGAGSMASGQLSVTDNASAVAKETAATNNAVSSNFSSAEKGANKERAPVSDANDLAKGPDKKGGDGGDDKKGGDEKK